MSQRKQQRRQARQNARRTRPVYEPVGRVRPQGVMGWFQHNERLFYIIGIAVMLGSLGAAFCGIQAGTSNTSTEDDRTPTPAVSATATATASPEPPIQRSYSAPPPMGIDTGRQYQALIHTTRGTVRIELLPKEAPTLVNNFVFLTRQRFYDGLTFHRVVPGFVAQGGDPTGTGFGGPGYQVQQDSNRLDFEAGVISMAKSNPSSPNVNGSQFFITLGPAPFLNGDFTVFGRVMEGLTVLRALAPRDGTQASQPPGERILSIEVLEQPAN